MDTTLQGNSSDVKWYNFIAQLTMQRKGINYKLKKLSVMAITDQRLNLQRKIDCNNSPARLDNIIITETNHYELLLNICPAPKINLN